MNPETVTRASEIAALVDDKPLAAVAAFSVLAVVVLFGALMWEKRSHQKTLREVVTLTTTFSAQWNRHLELEERITERLEHPAPLPSQHQERS